MNQISLRVIGVLFVAILAGIGLVAPAYAVQTTLVGSSTGRLVKTSGLVDTRNPCSPTSPPAPDIQAWWHAMQPANRKFASVGFQT